MLSLHPRAYKRLTELLRLGIDPFLPALSFDLESIADDERVDGWARLSADGGAHATAVDGRCPVNCRDGGVVVASVIAAEARGGELWGLLVWRKDGETDDEWDARAWDAVCMERAKRGAQAREVQP